MNLKYEVLDTSGDISICKDLCNELMHFQKSVAHIEPQLFDNMNFDTRMIPSIKNATYNYIIMVKDDENPIGYVYSNISPKKAYSNEFATFFDMNSVTQSHVGCLSQFYIKEDYRDYGIGTKLFNMSMEWLDTFNNINDIFIFVSNGNNDALKFYQNKGYVYSHDILKGFISVLRNK